MPRRLTALAFVLACATTAIADDMKMPINSGDLKWGPAPPTVPKGVEISVLSGDPSKDGQRTNCVPQFISRACTQRVPSPAMSAASARSNDQHHLS